jgi:anti-anti-sigma regulatory factor
MDVASQRTAASAESPLNIDRVVEGQVTCLRFNGVINEAFDGKRLAAGIKASTLVLDFGEIKRISSFGIREWAEFIQAVERNVQRIIAIEVTPKVVDQLNMVAQLLGAKGSVFSFYAPYRCDYCDVDSRVLLQVDRDRAAITARNPPERNCESCSRPEYFDEDAGTFFSYLAMQPPFELPPDVADFLASKLKYSVTGTERRLQIDKHIDGRNTFVKLVGNLDGSFPSSKIAEGLEGTIVVDVSGVGTIDLAGAAEWRNLVTQTKPTAERLLVVGCPPILLERLNRQGDLGDVVVSFSMPYSCQKCATTSSQMIDVAEHYDILKFATPPEMKCPQCKSPTVCSAPETLLSRLRTLSKPELDPALKRFIKEARERKPAKPAAAASRAAGPAAAPRMGLWMGLMFVALLGAAGLMVLVYLKQREAVPAGGAGAAAAIAEVQRPGWILADTPLVNYCDEQANRTGCVGVSSYLATKEAGQVEAGFAAVEAIVNSIALKIENETFSGKVRPVFDAARAEALAELERHQANPKSDEFQRALEKVRDRRRRVADSFRRTGGSAAPQQQAAWFWEEYKKSEGEGFEYLVFVRYDVDADALRNLINEYTSVVDAGGGKVVTAFPQLAWRLPAVVDGAMVVEPGKALAARGVAEGDVIVGVGGQAVRNAAEAQAQLKRAGEDAPLVVIGGQDGQKRELL